MINPVRPSFGAYLKFKIERKEFGTNTIKETNNLYINTNDIKYIEKNSPKNIYKISTPDHNIEFKSFTQRNIAEEIISASNNPAKIIDLTDCKI